MITVTTNTYLINESSLFILILKRRINEEPTWWSALIGACNIFIYLLILIVELFKFYKPWEKYCYFYFIMLRNAMVSLYGGTFNGYS